jgi:hypothetical protein
MGCIKKSLLKKRRPLGLNFRVRVSRNPCLKVKNIKKINKTNILHKIYAKKNQY